MKNKHINALGIIILLLILGYHFTKKSSSESTVSDITSSTSIRPAISEMDISSLPDSFTFDEMTERFGYGAHLEDQFMIEYKNSNHPDEIIFFCYHPLFKGKNPDLLQVFTSKIGGKARQLWKSVIWDESYTARLLSE